MLSKPQLEQAVFWACQQEVMAPKPGNVSPLSDGHDMEVADFIKSAKVIAPIMASNLTVGEKILQAVTATQDAVSTNTNLGIILLFAPLCNAYQKCNGVNELPEALKNTLADLTINDAINCYEAIRLANAGGLGNVTEHDVNAEPTITLLNAMNLAQNYDRIAYQYSHCFEDIWQVTLPALYDALEIGETVEWASAFAYLTLLRKTPDSLVCRKQSKQIAKSVMERASQFIYKLNNNNKLSDFQTEISHWDTELKQKKVNPGTSADIIAATLLMYALEKNY